MEQIPPDLVWTPSDAAGVNQFLNSNLGRKWLGVLLNRKPRSVVDKGMEQAALSGAFAAGYEIFFFEIAATRVSLPSADVGAKAIDMSRD